MLLTREQAPSRAVISDVIKNFVYAPRGGLDADAAGLRAEVDRIQEIRAAEKLTVADWQALLDEYFFARPCGAVIGRPSAALSKRNAEEEKQRLADQKAALGEEKLAALQARLDAAVAANEREIPEEVQTCVPIPSISKVRTIPVLSVRSLDDGEFFVARGSAILHY